MAKIEVVCKKSYTFGEKGTVLEEIGDRFLIKLDNEKKYPVPYRYFREEIRVYA